MSTFDKINQWMDRRTAPVWLDAIRVALGIFLFIKGLIFTANFQVLADNVQSMGMVYMAVIAAHYIYLMHAAGGLMIALGAYTRVICLLNLPILIGAVIFNATHFLTMDNLMELEMSALVLIGLIVFFAFGGGRFSVDELRRRDAQRKADMAGT